MALDMREIEAFLTVAEELHFGRAAERLGLSTSRVSNLVRTVERRAGTPMFERTSRRVRLTPAGERLFAELRPAYVRMERAFEEARRSAGSGAGEVLRVGFATTLPKGLEPAVVEAFEHRYPSARVVRSAIPTTELFRWLGRDWPVDLFVTWMPTDGAEVRAEMRVGPIIDRTPRAVMLPASHPLASRPSVDIEELAEHPMIRPTLPEWYGAEWTPTTTPAGREMILHRPHAEYIEDVLRLVAEQGYAHLTFASLLDAYQRPGVVVVPVTGLPPMPVRPVWPAGRRSSLVEAFVDVVSAGL